MDLVKFEIELLNSLNGIDSKQDRLIFLLNKKQEILSEIGTAKSGLLRAKAIDSRFMTGALMSNIEKLNNCKDTIDKLISKNGFETEHLAIQGNKEKAESMAVGLYLKLSGFLPTHKKDFEEYYELFAVSSRMYSNFNNVGKQSDYNPLRSEKAIKRAIELTNENKLKLNQIQKERILKDLNKYLEPFSIK